MAKVKYPLTEDAKDAAKRLVEAWDSGEIQQRLVFAEYVGDEATSIFMGANYAFDLPATSLILELSHFKLIALDITRDESQITYEILFMQELRNAVANDFEVSDFFLTTQAVGTIINAAENSRVLIPALQSAASAFGDVQQTQINTPAELSAKLLEILGSDVLESNPDLAQAIQELETTTDPQPKRQFGNVIMQLGHGLQHGANAVVVIQALGSLFQFLYTNKIL